MLNVTIEYCNMWGYLNQALSLSESLRKKFGANTTLIESSGGVFEVYNNLPERVKIFSKKELGRFPNENEVEELLEGWEEVK